MPRRVTLPRSQQGALFALPMNSNPRNGIVENFFQKTFDKYLMVIYNQIIKTVTIINSIKKGVGNACY